MTQTSQMFMNLQVMNTHLAQMPRAVCIFYLVQRESESRHLFLNEPMEIQ